jgi:integrase
MARETITDKKLKALKPAPDGKRIEIFDSIVPAMCVRVTDKGAKSFALVSRFGGKHPVRRVLGTYPAMTLERARERAREWLELVGKGIDPAELERSKRAAVEAEMATSELAHRVADRMNFKKALDHYLKSRERRGIRSVHEDRLDFNRDCVDAWKGRAVDSITMDDILEVLGAIDARGSWRQALNMAVKIGTFFNWCRDEELISESPYRPKRVTNAFGNKAVRDRVLSDDEIRAFWAATERVPQILKSLWRLLLLTGQRLNDIAHASWDEIDLEARTLTVPASRYKSNREHIIPLTDDALKIFAGMPRWDGCPYVFSLDGEKPLTLTNKWKGRLDAIMQDELRRLSGDDAATLAEWVNHDLRRTVRTRLSDLDVFDEVAEAVIGHATTELNRTYNKSNRLNVKLDALTRWQGALRQIVGTQTPPNVVSLHPKKTA